MQSKRGTGSDIEPPIFLVQGGDIDSVADAFTEFVAQATQSLHIAIYDFQLDGSVKTKVVDAINGAARNGVEVKLAYDHTKANAGAANKGSPGSDPAPRGTMEFVQANFPDLATKPIAGSHLMHDKYIIRDGGTDAAAVWMGSTNFTTGAWTLQENNILRLHSKDLADRYEQDFDDLWKSGNILRTGKNDFAELTVGTTPVEVAFCPGEGSAAASLFVDAIQGAGQTVWLSSMVISSGPILGALTDFLQNGGELRGTYDATEMAGVERDWQRPGRPRSPKLEQWLAIKPFLVGKHSTPYTEQGPHDFMHNKVLVTDRTVVTGSFNLSENAESNAENVLALMSPALAGAYQAYVEKLIGMYGKKR